MPPPNSIVKNTMNVITPLYAKLLRDNGYATIPITIQDRKVPRKDWLIVTIYPYVTVFGFANAS